MTVCAWFTGRERPDVVEPRILALGRGCEDRCCREVVRTARTHLRATCVGHMDVVAIVSFQDYAHVDDSDLAVGANQEPISAAREHATFKPRSLEFSASDVHDDSGSVRVSGINIGGAIWAVIAKSSSSSI